MYTFSVNFVEVMVLLRIEPTASHMLGKYSTTTELYSQPPVHLFLTVLEIEHRLNMVEDVLTTELLSQLCLETSMSF